MTCCRSVGGEHSGEIAGDGHRRDGADVGAAGVASWVLAQCRARGGDEEAAELPEDLVAVTVPPPELSMARCVRTWGTARGWLRMWQRSRWAHSAVELLAAL